MAPSTNVVALFGEVTPPPAVLHVYVNPRRVERPRSCWDRIRVAISGHGVDVATTHGTAAQVECFLPEKHLPLSVTCRKCPRFDFLFQSGLLQVYWHIN